MSVPVFQRKEYADRILDRGIALSKEEIQGYFADLRSELRKPNPPVALRTHYRLLEGALLERTGQHQDALLAFQEVVLTSRDPMAYNNLATVYLSLGRIDEALDALKIATQGPHPRRTIMLANLARATHAKGNASEASSIMSRAVEAANQNNYFEVHILATQTAALGQVDEALRFLARSLALRSGEAPGAERPIDVIRRLWDRHEEALQQTPHLHDVALAALAMEDALAMPGGTSLPLRVLGLARARAAEVPGITAVMVSQDGAEVVFTGPTYSDEVALPCQRIIREIRRELAPAGEPFIRGGFFDRGLASFEGYLRADLTP